MYFAKNRGNFEGDKKINLSEYQFMYFYLTIPGIF